MPSVAYGKKNHQNIMNEERIVPQSFPNWGDVTVLVYDLPDNTNPRANEWFKDGLEENGWQDTIPQALCRQFGVRDRYVEGDTMPSTTLWKFGATPTMALALFEELMNAYNANIQRGETRIKGKAVAFSVGQYAALLRV